MPVSTLKDKGQITMPSAIIEEIHASKGDVFDFRVIDDKVVMIRQELIPIGKKISQKRKNRVDISKYIGAGKGVYGSVVEIDKYISKERDAWG